jgi:hypothetical protein
MESNDGFFHGFSPTLLTIPKSKPLSPLRSHLILIGFFRVLLASIKYLGNCPCPRCLITKDQIHEIGMKRDKQRREKLSRVDSDRRKRTIELARKLIFDKGIRPGSKFVTKLLDENSLTPNRVCI